jgi:hypothetical protein
LKREYELKNPSLRTEDGIFIFMRTCFMLRWIIGEEGKKIAGWSDREGIAAYQ